MNLKFSANAPLQCPSQRALPISALRGSLRDTKIKVDHNMPENELLTHLNSQLFPVRRDPQQAPVTLQPKPGYKHMSTCSQLTCTAYRT